jgi:MFS family permease
MQPTPAQRNPWAILLVLVFGFFMILLDTTIVNIAIPSISTDLKASLDQILWVINGYILVYALLLVTAGRLGGFFGQRNLFAIGVVVFTAASAACGLAQDPSQLIAFRVVQGFGGALMAPQILALSPSRPPTSSRLPNDSAYAVTTHCRSLLEKPSACWADGSAMFTIVASSTSISWATATTTRTSQRRSADGVRRSRVAEDVLTDDIRSIPSLRLAELARLSVRRVRLDSEGIW